MMPNYHETTDLSLPRFVEPVTLWLTLFAVNTVLFYCVEGSGELAKSLVFAALSATLKTFVVCAHGAVLRAVINCLENGE